MRGFQLFLLLSCWAPLAWGQTSVSGTIADAEGEQMPVAHVEVAPYGGGRFMPVQMVAAQEGHYDLTLGSEGLYRLRFMGPLHGEFSVVVWVDDTTPLTLDVQLQRDWMDPDQSYTRVLTAHQQFSYEEGLTLTEQADGSYAAVVPTPDDTLAYYLEGATSQHYARLVMADLSASTFRYRGNGEYLALLASPGDSTTVALRPKQLDTVEPPDAIATFGDANPHAAAIWAMLERLEQSSPYTSMAMMRMGQREEEEETAKERDRKNVMRQEMLALEVAIDQAEARFERKVLLYEYLSRGAVVPVQWWGSRYRMVFGGRLEGPPVKQKYVQEALASIAPTSLLWGLQPVLLASLFDLTNDAPEVLPYLETVIAEHPMLSVREVTLLNVYQEFYAREGLTDRVAEYIARYKDMTGDRSRFDTFPQEEERNVVPGRRMPDLMSWSMYQRFSADSLKGKVALLDFTKSECGTCQADLAQLREVAERYSEQDLQIVQVSLDMPTSPADSTDNTPWITLQGEDGFNSRVAVGFEVMRLPHRVLIDLDGVILAVGEKLMGDQLIATLRGVFEE
ncbi:MAG TPA: thioredoxin-like domain-containing protein [Rhodothermales bacterium]|nr:thioredoxin-like domain-containing protein [Rhodothermales bacterium]